MSEQTFEQWYLLRFGHAPTNPYARVMRDAWIAAESNQAERIAALTAQLQDARAALEKHGRHRDNCEAMRIIEPERRKPCDCGFQKEKDSIAAALAKLGAT